MVILADTGLAQPEPGSVLLSWVPANLCVLGHKVILRAIRYLQPEEDLEQRLDPETEPVVYEALVLMKSGGKNLELHIKGNLTACVYHRVEVRRLDFSL